MLQRVNPLVPNKLQNINRRIYPSEEIMGPPVGVNKKEAFPTFETAS